MSYLTRNRRWRYSRYRAWNEMHERNERLAEAIIFLHELHKEDEPPKKPRLIERVMQKIKK